MNERDGGGMQEQAVDAEVLAEEAVVLGAAVFGIADDGVEDVLHVAAKLVFAAGLGQQLD